MQGQSSTTFCQQLQQPVQFFQQTQACVACSNSQVQCPHHTGAARWRPQQEKPRETDQGSSGTEGQSLRLFAGWHVSITRLISSWILTSRQPRRITSTRKKWEQLTNNRVVLKAKAYSILHDDTYHEVSLILDFSIPSTALGHLNLNHTFKILLHQLKIQVTVLLRAHIIQVWLLYHVYWPDKPNQVQTKWAWYADSNGRECQFKSAQVTSTFTKCTHSKLPRYNHAGWLGVKLQVSYLLTHSNTVIYSITRHTWGENLHTIKPVILYCHKSNKIVCRN